jgi:predicted DNA-binding transcriptional regulator AlpA
LTNIPKTDEKPAQRSDWMKVGTNWRRDLILGSVPVASLIDKIVNGQTGVKRAAIDWENEIDLVKFSCLRIAMHTNPSETKRLADAVAGIAATISEIIDARLKKAIETQAGLPSALLPNTASPKAMEGWVNKRDVAKHLNISVRSVDNWMAKGVLPHIRLGQKRVFFKLSEVDEAINRRFKRNGLW